MPPDASLALPLPAFVQGRIDRLALGLLQPRLDFSQPAGEPALTSPDSLSWQIFKNSVALFVGGVAAVILELAEPRVRTGVWEHSSFRREPLARLQRTGMAAMVTVYGAQSAARAMIAGVARRHEQVRGHTPDGTAYHANDVELLDWVQATASFGFAQAYHHYVHPLRRDQFDQFYQEAAPTAQLYGALGAPACVAQMEAMFAAMHGRLEASAIVHEFLAIMHATPILPTALRPIQGLLIRAAVQITPPQVRERLGLAAPSQGLNALQQRCVRAAGRTSERLLIRDGPAAQACRRLGLPEDYLYRAGRAPRARTAPATS